MLGGGAFLRGRKKGRHDHATALIWHCLVYLASRSIADHNHSVRRELHVPSQIEPIPIPSMAESPQPLYSPATLWSEAVTCVSTVPSF